MTGVMPQPYKGQRFCGFFPRGIIMAARPRIVTSSLQVQETTSRARVPCFMAIKSTRSPFGRHSLDYGKDLFLFIFCRPEDVRTMISFIDRTSVAPLVNENSLRRSQ